VGSKSKSRTSSSTKEITTNTVDNRIAEGDGDIGGNLNVNLSDSGGASLNITTSDFGALDAASEISESAFTFAGDAVGQLGATTSSAFDSVEETAEKAVRVAENAARDESARTLQFVVIGTVIVVTAFVLRKPIQKAIS